MPRKALTRGQKAAATRAANQAAARDRAAAASQSSDSSSSTADQREAQRIRLEATGHRPFVGDNMGTHTISDDRPTGRRLTVLHGAVGPHPRGATIYESHIGDARRTADLVASGALAWAGGDEEVDDDDEEDEEDDGDESEVVGELNLVPNQTLNEAAFSDSPPTLPRTDGIDVTQQEVDAAMAAGVGTSGPRTPEEESANASEGASTESGETKTAE